ncbi:flagellar hook-length control protein FliK [Candidatus Aerophobetes bacterium]|nr:flagellar hook-length control protein FliK [Candidatus Aerophobetes bacterium]
MRIPLLKILGKKESSATYEITKKIKRKEKKFQKFLGEAILNLQGSQSLLPGTSSNLSLKGKSSLFIKTFNKKYPENINLVISPKQKGSPSSLKKTPHPSLIKEDLNEKILKNPKQVKSLKIIPGKEDKIITSKRENISSLKDLSLSKIKEKSENINLVISPKQKDSPSSLKKTPHPSLIKEDLNEKILRNPKQVKSLKIKENLEDTTQTRENRKKSEVIHRFQSSLSGNLEEKFASKVNSHPLTQNVVFSHFEEERNLMTQIVAKIKFLYEHQDKSKGTIILKIEHLGIIRLHLSIQKADLSLNMQTLNQKTGELIQRNLEYLKSSLEKEGLFLKDFTLSYDQNSDFNEGREQEKNLLHYSGRRIFPIGEGIFPERGRNIIVSEEYHYVNYLI